MNRKRARPLMGPQLGLGSLVEIDHYLADIGRVIASMPQQPLVHMVESLLEAGQTGKTVFILGNGGSAATASHMACDLAKTASVPGIRRLRAIALTDNTPLLTAWGNDASYEVVFAEQLRTLARRDDLVIAISASGNSPNVIAAAQAARELGARVIGVTGFGGGRLQPLCDICLVVPSDAYGPVEDAHMILVHAITAAIRASLTAHVAARASVMAPAGEPVTLH